MFPNLSRRIQARPFSVFFGVLALALILSTQLYYRSQFSSGSKPATWDEITERHKELLSEEQEMSKWLLSISSGALTATLLTRLSSGKQVAEGEKERVSTVIAWACLIVSLYGGFLSYQMQISVLQRGPMDLVYEKAFLVPTLIQMYFLLLGLLALGWSVFRQKKMAAVALVFLFLGFAGRAAQAQKTQKPDHTQTQNQDQKTCIKNWYADREHAPNVDPTVADHFLTSLARKAARQPLDKQTDPQAAAAGRTETTCDVVNRTLDRVRLQLVHDTGQPETVDTFTAYLQGFLKELDRPGASVGDAVARFMEALMPWAGPFGVLGFHVLPDAKTNPVYSVILDNLQVGYTPLGLRVRPGPHRILVMPLIGYEPIFQSNDYVIKDGDNKLIALPVQP